MNTWKIAVDFFLFSSLAVIGKTVVEPVGHEKVPFRVHVFEDYETDIEKRWWLRGEPIRKSLPLGLSESIPNKRACRSTETKDFDRKMVDQSKTYQAVIFNPVPGPPMASNTHLSFRCRLKRTDVLRCQIYSLSKGYHRHLVLRNLPKDKWQALMDDIELDVVYAFVLFQWTSASIWSSCCGHNQTKIDRVFSSGSKKLALR